MLARMIDAQKVVAGLASTEPYEITGNYYEFLTNLELEDEPKNRVTFLIGYCIKKFIDVTFVDDIEYTNPGNPEATVPIDAFTVDDSVLAILTNSVEAANQWVIDLTAANQVGKLVSRNITSYFASRQDTPCDANAIAALLKWISSSAPKLMDSAEIRNILPNEKWIKYHTSYSSTAALVNRFLESIPVELSNLATVEDRDIVADSLASPHSEQLNSLIPNRLIALSSIYFEVNDIDVGDWVQGRNSRNAVSVTFINQAKIVFKRLTQISKDVRKVSKAFTESELASCVTFAPEELDPAVVAQAARNVNARRDEYLAFKNLAERRRHLADPTYVVTHWSAADVTVAEINSFYESSA